MKLIPSGKKPKKPNPFEAIQKADNSSVPEPRGAGIGVDGQRPGLGRPRSAKRRRWDAQVLGETPPRDGPFQFSAAPVAQNFPPRRRVDPRKKQTGIDPFGTLDKVNKKEKGNGTGAGAPSGGASKTY